MVTRLYSVSPWGNLTGAPICALEHLRVLRNSFDEVCLVLCQPGGLAQRAAAVGIPIWCEPLFAGLRGKSRLAAMLLAWRIIPLRCRYVWRLYRKLMKEPGILHLHSLAEHTPYTLLAGWLARVPVVISIHEPWTGGWTAWFQSWLVSCLSDHVVFPAQALADSHPWFLRRNGSTMPYAAEVAPLRDRNLARKVPLVVMPALMSRRKGYDIFLQVCRRLHEDGAAFEAWMGGGGWHLGQQQLEAKKYLKAHGLDSFVKDLDLLPEIGPLYEQMDILLLTSRRDPLPRVIMEAMCHGIPVVATRVDGIPEMVEDGVTGFLVESGDVEGFAQAVERLLENKGLRGQLGAAGRARAEQLFSPAKYAEAMNRIYAGLRRGADPGGAA
ncbi:MAG: glycosyltransferase family 1 protein [Opitutae bacterium]|nr:glycosyltransferase family 1 protein [Opitutae bacterium]